jgi:hypothetical protein
MPKSGTGLTQLTHFCGGGLMLRRNLKVAVGAYQRFSLFVSQTSPLMCDNNVSPGEKYI